MSVESLEFPAVMITRPSAQGGPSCQANLVANKADLGHMRYELYYRVNDPTISDPPIVIYGAARALEMTEIVGERGGLWMMMNPTSSMPISYKLLPRKNTGMAAALTTIAGCSRLGRDLDEERTEIRRERIRIAKDMKQILEIIDDRSDFQYPAVRTPKR